MPAAQPPEKGLTALRRAIANTAKPVFLVSIDGEPGVSQDGRIVVSTAPSEQTDHYPLLSWAPPLLPHDLGNAAFKKRYHIKYPYVAGAMAHGISSVELVKAAASAKMIGFFGAAGLPLADLEAAIIRLKSELAATESQTRLPYGLNLVFSGNPELEMAMVNLYLKHGIDLISAAGYLKITLPLLCFRIKGIYRDADNTVVCPNKIIAKTSRLEIAKQFLSPPPDKMIAQLVQQKLISKEEASLAGYIPVAQDLTAEADSGGHTDNRAAISLLPSMIDLRDRLAQTHQYASVSVPRPCIGLGGGIATPKAVAAAFAMGADYVLSGSINQACVEAGTSQTVKQMLAAALQTDVIMAPSANMFERGIKVQVLKRGSLFAQRAARLYEIYRNYDDISQLPDDVKNELETKIFQNSLDAEWAGCRGFFDTCDPGQIEAAKKNPKRKMALLFRSYLGKSSKWAIRGDTSRQKDFQIWCGPAMGAFNEWAQGSFLENPDCREFETVAMNLLFGACVVMRRQFLLQGFSQEMAGKNFSLPPEVGKFTPLTLEKMNEILEKV